jgi:hypothetical protein
MTFPKLLKTQALAFGTKKTALRKKSLGIWQNCNWLQYFDNVRILALGLHSLGFNPGDKLAIIGNIRPESLFAEIAAQAAGCAPIVKAFEEEVRNVQLNVPKIPCMSNVTGRWLSKAEATDPAYWARHANHTARFSDALHTLWQFRNAILLELGPGRTLAVLAMQHPDKKNAGNPNAISSLRHHYENQQDVEFLMRSVGRRPRPSDSQPDRMRPPALPAAVTGSTPFTGAGAIASRPTGWSSR